MSRMEHFIMDHHSEASEASFHNWFVELRSGRLIWPLLVAQLALFAPWTCTRGPTLMKKALPQSVGAAGIRDGYAAAKEQDLNL
eukprot:SAG31_NODE_499_length_14841_cov_7.930471_17_plen_84_part_00